MVAEYNNLPAVSENQTSYLTTDSLGTPRVVTKADGSVRSRHDYLPFGEEIDSNIGGRSAMPPYVATDGIGQKFTGKERDDETELDYFGARYYNSRQGRFISADTPNFSIGTDPQTWNLYAYTANNPLNRVDVDGHDWFKIGDVYFWRKGKEFSYKDENGETKQATNVGTHLIVFKVTGRNSDGALVGTLTLWNQDKKEAEAEAFSGGGNNPVTGKPYNDIPFGVFKINLQIPEDWADESDLREDGSLKEVYGRQRIDAALNDGRNWRAWGSRRVRLNILGDIPEHSLPEAWRGNYIHGRNKPGDFTASCICDRKETVLDAIFKINSKITPRVQVVVTNNEIVSRTGGPKPFVLPPR